MSKNLGICCADKMVIGRWYKIISIPRYDDCVSCKVSYSINNKDVAFLAHDTVYIKKKGGFTITATDTNGNTNTKIIQTIEDPTPVREEVEYTPTTWNDFKTKILEFGEGKLIKIKKGTYDFNIKPEDTLNIPKGTLLDFNNSTLNIYHEGNDAYMMFNICADFSGIRNCKFIGKGMYKVYSISEQCRTIEVTRGSYGLIENIYFKDLPGFNLIVGGGESFWNTKPEWTSGRWLAENSFAGYINPDNGQLVASDQDWCMKDAVANIVTTDNSFCAGWSDGWIRSGVKIYDIAFYDDNDNFITIFENCQFFKRFYFPENSTKFRMCIHIKREAPTNTNPADDYCFVRLKSGYSVSDLMVKNIRYGNNASGGVSVVGICEDTHFDNIQIIGNGWRNAWAFDYEDGWQGMLGSVISHCLFAGTLINHCVQGLSIISSILYSQVSLIDRTFYPTIINSYIDTAVKGETRGVVTYINSYIKNLKEDEKYKDQTALYNVGTFPAKDTFENIQKALKTANKWWDSGILSIKTNLVNCSISNNITEIEENKPYTATITPNENYILDTPTITMDGKDITSSSYNDGKINISKVTGNITIALTAKDDKPVTYSINNKLFNCNTDNNSTSIQGNSKYSATITPKANYTVKKAIVTMDGKDITSSSYNDGKINISNVTGNIDILLSYIDESVGVLETSTSSVYGFNGSNYIVGVRYLDIPDNQVDYPITTSSDKITTDIQSISFDNTNNLLYKNISVSIAEDCADTTGFIKIGDKKVDLNISSKAWDASAAKGSISCKTDTIYIVEGEKTQLSISINNTPQNNQPVIISSTDPYLNISNKMFNFNVGNTDPVTIEFEATEDGIIQSREGTITVQSLDTIKTMKIITIDDIVDGVGKTYGNIKLTGVGGGYLRKEQSGWGNYFRVSLESQPSDYQIVTITSNNPKIQPNPSRLVFAPDYWDYNSSGYHSVIFDYVGDLNTGIHEKAAMTFSTYGASDIVKDVIRLDEYFDGTGATETLPTDGLIVNYDFKNITPNTDGDTIIYDKISNLPYTLEGTATNYTIGTDYIERTAWGTSYLDASSIQEDLFKNMNTKGLTISYACKTRGGSIITYDENKQLNGQIKITNIWNSTQGPVNISVPYITNDNELKTCSTSVSKYYEYDNYDNYKEPAEGVDCLWTFVIRPDGYMDCYFNQYRLFESIKATNFKEWSIKNNTKYFDLIKKGYKQQMFRAWNKALSYSEIYSNVLYEQSFVDIQSINTACLTEMHPNSTTSVYTTVVPDFKQNSTNINYAPLTSNISFNNDQFTVSDIGTASFKTIASNITTGDKLKELSTDVNVAQILNLTDDEKITSTKTDGKRIAITTRIEELEVGEEFEMFAYVLPRVPADDNLIKWTSSDPSIASVGFGVLNAIKPGNVTITASTLDDTISKTIDIKIVDKVVEQLQDNEIYKVTIPCKTTNGELYIDNTNAISTTKAIQDIIEYAKNNNKKKIIFPKGTYLVSPDATDEREIFIIPSNLTLDFSDSIMNMSASDKVLSSNPGYYLFNFDYNINHSKLMNLHFIGERDQMESKTSTEKVTVLNVADCQYCEFENLTIEKGLGFTTSVGTLQRKGTSFIGITEKHIEAGGIDENGQPKTEIESGVWRVSDWYCDLNTAKIKDIIQLCPIHGYHGRQPVSRTFDIFYYDENKTFIKAEYDCMQAYTVPVPDGAYYCKVVVYQPEKPTNWSDPIWYAMCLSCPGVTTRCKFKNCTFKNSRTMNVVFGGRHNTFDGCNFIQEQGVSICSLDIEDCWEKIFGNIWKNCYFQGNIFAVCGGASQVFHNNVFKNITINIATRSFGHRWYLNEFKKGGYLNFSGHQTDGLVAMNTINGGSIKIGTENYHGNATQYKVRSFRNIKI